MTSSYPDNSKLSAHPEVKQMIKKLGPITLENDCWVGTGAVIFPNVTLGKGCIVGSGTVVKESVPPFSVVVGSPARIVRVLNPSKFR